MLKRILIMLLVLVLGGTAFIIYDAVTETSKSSKDDEEDDRNHRNNGNSKASDLDVFYSEMEDGRLQGFLYDVNQDVEWKIVGDDVIDEATILLTDQYDHDVAFQVSESIMGSVIVVDGSYEAGGQYRIKLPDEIAFDYESLEGVKDLTFTIAQEETLEVAYTEDVVKLLMEDFQSTNQSDTFIISDEPVEAGDIIVIEGGHSNGISDIVYKVASTEQDGEDVKVSVEEALIDEIYDSIDISQSYGLDDGVEVKIDMDALEREVEESGLIDLIVSKVYADNPSGTISGVKISYKGIEEGFQVYDIVVSFEDFISDGVDLNIGMTFKLDMSFFVDAAMNRIIDFEATIRTDVKIIFDSDFKVEIEASQGMGDRDTAIFSNYSFAGGDDNLAEQISEIKDDVSNIVNKERSLWDGIEIKLADVNIPVFGPINLSFEGDIFLKNSFSLDDIAVNDEIMFAGFIQVNQRGFNLPSINAGANFQSYLGDISLVGIVDSKLGMTGRIELELCSRAGVGVEFTKGIKAELKAMLNINQGEQSGFYYKFAMGDYHEIKAIAGIDRMFAPDIEVLYELVKGEDTFDPWFELGHFKVNTGIEAVNLSDWSPANPLDVENTFYLDSEGPTSARVGAFARYYDIFDDEYDYELIDIESVDFDYDSDLIRISRAGEITLDGLLNSTTEVIVNFDQLETVFEVVEVGETTIDPGMESVIEPKVSAGGEHAVALKADGTVWTWGSNVAGQLGNGTQTKYGDNMAIEINNDALRPIQIFEGAIDISAGGEFTLILTEDHELYGCGNNVYGQLGQPGYGFYPEPTLMATDVVAMDAGRSISAFITSNGDLFVFGKTSQYEYLAYGGEADVDFSYEAKFVMSNVKDVALASRLMLILTNDHVLYAEGRIVEIRELRDGEDQNYSYTNAPELIAYDIQSIEVGNQVCMYTDFDNTLYTWGANGYSNSLGTGTDEFWALSHEVVLEDIVDYNQQIAVDQSGNLYVWGTFINSVNYYYEYSDGGGRVLDEILDYGAWPVNILVDVIQCDQYQGTLYAIDNELNLYSWGSNIYGQIGDGTVTQLMIEEIVDYEYLEYVFTVIDEQAKMTPVFIMNLGQ